MGTRERNQIMATRWQLPGLAWWYKYGWKKKYKYQFNIKYFDVKVFLVIFAL